MGCTRRVKLKLITHDTRQMWREEIPFKNKDCIFRGFSVHHTSFFLLEKKKLEFSTPPRALH